MQWQKIDNGFTVDNDDFKLRLTFRHDELELLGDIEPFNTEGIITPDELINSLGLLGLQGKIEIKNVQQFCYIAAEGKPVNNMLLMQGVVPVAGEHGKLEIFNLAVRGIDGRSETVTNVRSGQPVASIVPPTSGTAGMTLTGKMIPPHPGVSAKVTLGHGVEWAKDANSELCSVEIIANTDGRVVFDAMNGTLSVLDTLVVEGNINHKYGDVDFIGSIEIHGDVECGHVIKSGKWIKISGNVESPQIEAGGDVEIGGGVAGKEKGFIKSGGNVSMRYLDSCRIECKGNLVVRNEIVDSTVFSCGHIDVTNGSIIGGKIMSLGGIEAKVFGSEVGIHTLLIPGKNFLAEREISVLEEEECQIKTKLEAISRKLDHYIKNPHQLSRITDHERQDLQRITGDFTRMNIHLMEIPDAIAVIRESMLKNANPMVNVGKMIAKGVEINIGTTAVIIPETIRRSITVVKNSLEDGLRYINRIRLVDNAIKVEHDIAIAELQRSQHHNK